jgi:hypothetical protein
MEKEDRSTSPSTLSLSEGESVTDSLGVSLQDAGKQYSIESTKTLDHIQDLKDSYQSMQLEVEGIQKSTDMNDYKTVSKAKSQLAQVLGNIEKLQFNQLDAVSTVHLDSGKDAAKSSRRELHSSLDELQEFVSSLYERYEAIPTPPVLSPSSSVSSMSTADMCNLSDSEDESKSIDQVVDEKESDITTDDFIDVENLSTPNDNHEEESLELREVILEGDVKDEKDVDTDAPLKEVVDKCGEQQDFENQETTKSDTPTTKFSKVDATDLKNTSASECTKNNCTCAHFFNVDDKNSVRDWIKLVKAREEAEVSRRREAYARSQAQLHAKALKKAKERHYSRHFQHYTPVLTLEDAIQTSILEQHLNRLERQKQQRLYQERLRRQQILRQQQLERELYIRRQLQAQRQYQIQQRQYNHHLPYNLYPRKSLDENVVQVLFCM